LRPPRDIAADMVKAADAAIKEVWERESEGKTTSELRIKSVVWAHVCNAFARRGNYESHEVTS
jgi:hypothetical protein